MFIFWLFLGSYIVSVLFYIKCIKNQIRRIYETDNKLFRLSGYTISFIGDCNKLFNICKVDDDDDGEFWDNIYTWRGKYYDMEWDELKMIIQQFISEYAVNNDGFDEAEQQDCLNDLEILFSAIDIAKDELVDEITRGKNKHLKMFKRGHQKIKNLIKRLGARF